MVQESKTITIILQAASLVPYMHLISFEKIYCSNIFSSSHTCFHFNLRLNHHTNNKSHIIKFYYFL